MPLGLSESLPLLVGRKFQAANAGKHLLFSSTELSIVRTKSGIPFQLRFCPALARKPVQPSEQSSEPTKKIDPFDKPSPDLHIADIPNDNPSHILVLNKYPVIANHFILATKEYKAQTHQLEEDDLAVALECIKEWESGRSEGSQRRLYAFFNSGPHSGASQAHRHLQFLPVESMNQQDPTGDWTLLVDKLGESSTTENIGFGFVQAKLPTGITNEDLHRTYLDLYNTAEKMVRDYTSSSARDLELHPTEGGELPISYNLAMSSAVLAILPRRREGAAVIDEQDSFVALNGTVLSGSLMVKNATEYETLRRRPEVLDGLLESIGIPRRFSKVTTDSNRL